MSLTFTSIIVLFMSLRVKRDNSKVGSSLQLFKASGYIAIVTAGVAYLYIYLSLETTIFDQIVVWYGVLFIILIFLTGGIFFWVRLMFNLRGVNLFFISKGEREKREKKRPFNFQIRRVVNSYSCNIGRCLHETQPQEHFSVV